MGWAAKAKHLARAAGESTLAGNPVPVPLMATYVTTKAHREAVKAGRPLRAKYSDREYAMDANGTLRRLRPQPVVLSTLKFSGPPPTV